MTNDVEWETCYQGSLTYSLKLAKVFKSGHELCGIKSEVFWIWFCDLFPTSIRKIPWNPNGQGEYLDAHPYSCILTANNYSAFYNMLALTQ